ncbi:MAG TPA: OmpA family protein [Burkholderiales bacterium]|nr:OmpA family protein [Burkholderiales bacterium]
MLKKIVILLSIATTTGSLTACCTSTPPPSKPEASAPIVATEPEVAAPVEPVSTPSNHNSVYFSFDKYDIKGEFHGIIKANSDYLVSHADARVQVQGNTDDIGSVEYNIALGQKRANSVRQALVAEGANYNTIETVSYGKLKAKYSNDKASRRGNRRADIVYKSAQPQGYSIDDNGLPMVNNTFYSGEMIPEGVVDQRDEF